MSAADDRNAEAQKARADELRRTRDERNARINSEAPTEADEGSASGGGDGDPNYVDLIDQEMRRDGGGDGGANGGGDRNTP